MKFLLTNIQQRDLLHQGVPLPFSLEQTDGVFILIVICFIMFVYVYQGNIRTFKSNIQQIITLSQTTPSTRNTTSRDIWYRGYLILQFTIFTAITLYSIFNEKIYPTTNNTSSLLTIGLFTILISLFLVIKSSLYRFIGYTFNISTEMRAFRISQLFIVEFLGIIYFIPTLLVIYSGYLHTTICIAMGIVFVIAQLIFFSQLTILFLRKKFNFLYTIAYLCSMEIIPYILLTFGIIYLYNNTETLTVLW